MLTARARRDDNQDQLVMICKALVWLAELPAPPPPLDWVLAVVLGQDDNVSLFSVNGCERKKETGLKINRLKREKR